MTTTSVHVETLFSPIDVPTSPAEALARVRALRPELAALGRGIDAEGVDAAEAMAMLARTGAQALNVPRAYGGLLGDEPTDGYATFIECLLEVSAADGSVGQMWGSNGVVARTLLTESSLSESTRTELAHEILHGGLRLSRMGSERGAAGPTTGRVVEGGVVLRGTKAFGTNTGAGGRTVAVIPHLLLGADDDLTTARPHVALVRLDSPGVEPGHDWDGMGQRGTDSQTIRFDDVFVPDGWHLPAAPPPPLFVATFVLGLATLTQGIGEGALAATVDHLRDFDRPSMPMFDSPASDPILHRRLGGMSARLAANRALVLATARAVEAAPTDGAALADTVLGALHTDIVVRDGVSICSELFDLTGARSATRGRGLDRFWRNARTLSSHHPVDSIQAVTGATLLNGVMPPLSEYVKM